MEKKNILSPKVKTSVLVVEVFDFILTIAYFGLVMIAFSDDLSHEGLAMSETFKGKLLISQSVLAIILVFSLPLESRLENSNVRHIWFVITALWIILSGPTAIIAYVWGYIAPPYFYLGVIFMVFKSAVVFSYSRTFEKHSESTDDLHVLDV